MSTTEIWEIYELHSVSKEPVTVAYLEPCQVSKRERFAKIVNG